MAAQEPAGLGGVVAGGPATEPRHRGRNVLAADDADAVVVAVRTGPPSVTAAGSNHKRDPGEPPLS